jgi:sulfur carrier protein
MTRSTNLSIQVNGETHTVAENTTMSELLTRLDLLGKRIAVERNGEIVPKSRYGDTRFEPGDAIEIVVAVGGG